MDKMMREVEENCEGLYSDVPDSRLREFINNPVNEGIDKDQAVQRKISSLAKGSLCSLHRIQTER